MNEYALCQEPRGEDYRRLLAHSVGRCWEAQLVIRYGTEFGRNGVSILERLSPWLIGQARVSEWFGTKLQGGTAELVRYRMCLELAVVLAESAGGLYEWMQPDRPEDLALLWREGAPWLVSTAHERNAYLSMTNEQAETFSLECPSVSRWLAPANAARGR